LPFKSGPIEALRGKMNQRLLSGSGFELANGRFVGEEVRCPNNFAQRLIF